VVDVEEVVEVEIEAVEIQICCWKAKIIFYGFNIMVKVFFHYLQLDRPHAKNTTKQ
jgi:hypothetical protein